MILEEQRILHEDIERLEDAIADRLLDNPTQNRERLARDHQISAFLARIQEQAARLLDVYTDADGSLAKEITSISTGDPLEAYNGQLCSIQDFHKRYPRERAENLERAYKRRAVGEDEPRPAATFGGVDVENMFTGEEGYGNYFDLTSLHEDYVNLPGVKGARRVTYLQYLDNFDQFTPPQCPVKREDKLTDMYFRYVGSLAGYLESFMRRTRPLEEIDKVLATYDGDFEQAWEKDEVPGWSAGSGAAGHIAGNAAVEGAEESVWCADCEKSFKNENVYKHHLTQKKHIKRVQTRAALSGGETANNGVTSGAGGSGDVRRLKEKAIAEREFRIRKLTSAMQTQRTETRTNVERKQGMTEKERAQEIEAVFAESQQPLGTATNREEDGDSDDEEKIYNPLKLPLAWDGKPIPFWLYKLHGLGVEFSCEICGNFVYMGRRAFDKHFNEARHVYGLKALGITSTTLFRDITKIDEALKLWDKLQRDKRDEKKSGENIVQMEDTDGNVMPEKVYWDLHKQGLL